MAGRVRAMVESYVYKKLFIGTNAVRYMNGYCLIIKANYRY
jgi:hypothetical protein